MSERTDATIDVAGAPSARPAAPPRRPAGVGVAEPARDVASVALLAVLVLLFGWRLIAPDVANRQYIASGDFTQQFYPFHRFLGDELRAGRLPLWNPYVYGGHPFSADPQTGSFYPLNWVAALLLGGNGLSFTELEAQVLANLFLAAILTYGFVCQLTASRVGGLFAAIAFAFSGFMTSYPVQQLAMLQSAVWLPGVLWAVGGAARAARFPARRVAIGAVALALCLLAGHPQMFLYVAYAALAYGLVAGREAGQGWRTLAARLGAIGALAAGLAAIQLLPTLELTAHANRERLLYGDSGNAYELKALGGLLVPMWRGEKGLYAGVATLALAGLAMAGHRRAPLAFWAGLALVGTILAAGANTALFQVPYLLGPGFSLFRDQERIGVLVVFALAVLGSHGAAELLGRASAAELDRFRRWLGVALAVAALFAIEIVILWTGAPRDANPYQVLLDNAVLLLLALALLLVAVLARRRGAAIAAALLLATLAFDLFTVNANNNLAHASADLTGRFGGALALVRAESEPYRVRIENDEAVPPNYGAVWRVPQVGGGSPIRLRRVDELLRVAPEWRLWQLFNVNYQLATRPREDSALALLGVVDGLYVYRVAYSMPRVWAVTRVEVAGGEAESLRATLDPATHPGDRVVLEEPPRSPIAPAPARPNTAVTLLETQRVVISAAAATAAIVVVADAHYPGWRAYLDGQPTPLLRANYAFRAVEMPPGEHTIEMRFESDTVRLGGTIAGLAALVATALAITNPREPSAA